MAGKDDSVVKREEFLAALRTLEPVSEDKAANEDSSSEGEEETAIAAIAEGVEAEVAKRMEEGESDLLANGAGAVATLSAREGRLAETVESGLMDDGPTFEDLVRDALGRELRDWLNANLEPLTERIVREEIRTMGRRQRRG